MPHCAFLTMANQEGWFVDDHLVHPPLRQLGWEIEEVAWDSDADWDRYDVVVIRSPWDYQRDPVRFFAALERIERSRATLYNSLAIVRWNIDKQCLFDLQAQGIEIVPMLRLDGPTPAVVREMFSHFATDQIILKPTISANADDTFRLDRDTSDAELGDICPIFSTRPCLVQPFMNRIITEGEFSVMYLDGQHSHSILKTVAEGDFRVQEEHGGGVTPLAEPAAELIAAADKSMGALSETPMYARVDLVRTDHDTFALMELELIEPCLYFRFSDTAADEFAKVIDCRFHGT